MLIHVFFRRIGRNMTLVLVGSVRVQREELDRRQNGLKGECAARGPRTRVRCAG